MSQLPLFTQEELADQLHHPVTSAAATAAERLVWGWLRPILQLTDRPDPVPPEVFSWAIELAGIAHENPASLRSEQLGPAQRSYSSERRAEILEEAWGFGATGSGAVAQSPQGSFPPPRAYPDAAW